MAGSEAAAARISAAPPAAAATTTSRPPGPHPSDLPPEQRLELLARIDELRWAARWDGRPAAAQWLADRYDGAPVDEERLRARSLDLLDLHSARLVPLLAVAPRTGAWWAVWPRTPGVPLPRLRALCELSPRQAAAVGLSVLHAVQDLHARGWWHGRLGTGGLDGSGDPDGSDVVVAPDGTARLGGWAAGTLLLDGPADALRRDDLLAVRALAADLLARTRTGARWSAEQREAEVAAVAHAGDGPMDHGTAPDAPHPVALALEQRLAALVGGSDLAERTRLELAALVRAVPPAVDAEPDPAGNADVPDPTVPRGRRSLRYPRRPPSSQRPAPPRRAPSEPRADRGSWLWKAIVALTVLAVVVGLELGLLGGRIANDLRVLRSPAPSATAGSGTNARAVAALPSLGPSTAGVVAKVDARAVGTCLPGKACTLRVVVQVERQQRVLPVRWSVVAVDRCTTRRSTLPGGSLTVPAGSTTGSTLRTVTLPNGKALAVGAMTTSPARAASKPLPAPARPATC
ncbi:MAG TPA: hypothetical protein VFS29_13235 [Motilibacteraceae bacterium]|nr:hypothetical protein [Motilibacteraceae bacterium]